MPTGIEVINTFGTTLIDSEYPVLAVSQKGFLNPTYKALHGVGPQGTYVIASTGFASVGAFGGNAQISGDPSYQVTWLKYDDPPDSTTGGWVVKDAAGKVTFNALAKSLVIVDIFVVNDIASTVGTRYYKPGRTYGVLFLVRGGSMTTRFVRTSGTTYRQEDEESFVCAKVNGNAVTWGYDTGYIRRYEEISGSNLPTNYTITQQRTRCAVVDITSY